MNLFEHSKVFVLDIPLALPGRKRITVDPQSWGLCRRGLIPEELHRSQIPPAGGKGVEISDRERCYVLIPLAATTTAPTVIGPNVYSNFL